jgi:hypothetical protein
MRLDPGRPRPRCRTGVLVRGFVQRADIDLADRTMAEYAGQTLDMVSVVVRQHDQRQPAYTKSAQTPIDGVRVRPRVKQHRLTRRRAQDHRIALADVADDHRPVPWWPRRWDDVNGADTDHYASEHRGRGATCLLSVHKQDTENEHAKHGGDSDRTVRPTDRRGRHSGAKS